ncbi:phage tail protein I [Pseudomonas sp. C9-3]|uniref:phage tail protein I n=1 Tax=Pseudomonas sp. C9-3 TaxID=3078264 RepID=UPI0028E6557F|nr:phage tail protein I [Pseudomonas sp. C9-3]
MSSLSLLPHNSSALERALGQVGAHATDLPVILRSLWNPETCPLNLLPWLAWAWSVDDWDDAWTERQKRDTVAQALAVQRIKGTTGAVKRALGALGMPVRIQEWFNQTPAGQPYTFRLLLDVDQSPLTKTDLGRLLDVVNSTKNLRSHLETLLLTVSSLATTRVAVVACLGSDICLGGFEAPRLIPNELALPLGSPVQV